MTALAARVRRHAPGLPWPVYALAAGVVLDLSADTFVVFTVLWIAGPQGWTGAKTALVVVALRLHALAGGWLGGRGVDRFGPKPMMIGQALLRVGCLAALAAGAWSGRFPLVLVLVLGGLSGAMLPIGYAGARTLVPRLLPAGQLARGNAWLAVGDQASMIAGAVLVGPLVATVGAGQALLAPVGMLAVAAGLFALLPGLVKPAPDRLPTDNSKKRVAPVGLAEGALDLLLADNSKKRAEPAAAGLPGFAIGALDPVPSDNSKKRADRAPAGLSGPAGGAAEPPLADNSKKRVGPGPAGEEPGPAGPASPAAAAGPASPAAPASPATPASPASPAAAAGPVIPVSLRRAGASPWRSRAVLALLALSFVYYLAYGPFEPALPYFTRQQLHAGPGAYSGLWVVFGIGALAGLSLAPRLTRRRPGVVNAAGTTLWAVVTFPLLWCSSVVPAAAVMLVSGAVWGPYLAVEATALQQWVEPAWHGRLFGLQHALLGVASPVGAAAGSLALASVSSRTVLGAAMLGCAVAGVAIGATRAIRRTPAGSGTGTAGSPGPPARAPG